MRLRAFPWAVLALGLGGPAVAADHNEADGTKADDISDIDDVYAWHTGDGKVVVAVTFGGPGAEGGRVLAPYDDQVIYGVHLDTTGDGVAEHDVWVRFGQNGAGDWGVQFTGIPGANATVEGAVQTTLAGGGIGLNAVAGVYDDPFFFDFQGLLDTLGTGTVMFQSNRDSFAGMNVNAFVFELDAAAVGATSFKLWATSGRK
jgi:hypothetical protein